MYELERHLCRQQPDTLAAQANCQADQIVIGQRVREPPAVPSSSDKGQGHIQPQPQLGLHPLGPRGKLEQGLHGEHGCVALSNRWLLREK